MNKLTPKPLVEQSKKKSVFLTFSSKIRMTSLHCHCHKPRLCFQQNENSELKKKKVDKDLTDSAMKPGHFMIPHSCLFHMQGRPLFIDQPFFITWCSGRNKAIFNSTRVKETVNLWIKVAKLGHWWGLFVFLGFQQISICKLKQNL